MRLTTSDAPDRFSVSTYSVDHGIIDVHVPPAFCLNRVNSNAVSSDLIIAPWDKVTIT